MESKNLLIIYPHWPPSNLAGVHRARLVSNFIKDFGWRPVILTVESRYYEEEPDDNMCLLVRNDTKVIYTKAYKVMKPRIIGDIGIRAFRHLYKEAKKIILNGKIDFVWIPIPSFYTSLLGRLLYEKTGIPYGIDYIDPWVRDITNQNDRRHRLSVQLAKILEPVALKKASLITGVSFEYFRPVLERNFKKRQSENVIDAHEKSMNFEKDVVGNYSVRFTAFPYGFDPKDHEVVIENLKLPWPENEEIKPWIYAGAFLPNSRWFTQLFFQAVAELRKELAWDETVRFYFLGTGGYKGTSILEYAKIHGIDDIVAEDRQRFPYLHILNFLAASDTVMVIGSTEKHYTASKVYQALLSKKPVWAIFHESSSAVQVMDECRAGQYLVKYSEDDADEIMKKKIKQSLSERLKKEDWNPDLSQLDKYSAKASAKQLVKAIERAIG